MHCVRGLLIAGSEDGWMAMRIKPSTYTFFSGYVDFVAACFPSPPPHTPVFTLRGLASDVSLLFVDM